ncbi:hypothetical protein GCM10025868_10400 [Angustibacter aerolatus]|uniref:NAD(P)-binding domain-containing protein n=1 Tax=Angustibacter aerolatus TaxID=1162965 RepID=A0ABQ6JF29_9ACTN|nr:hypothetical protein GCM10025868_10400 [Angustibacter aerolatus]
MRVRAAPGAERVGRMTQRIALVTGATGYIGGRLVPGLLAAGFTVRCLVRRPASLRDRPWVDQVEVVEGDAGDAEAVQRAAQDTDVAYYLVHSLASGKRFERRDRDMARAFGRGARKAGARRIVYLGGLYPEGVDLSPHLDSRKEVGEILLDSGVPTVVLRAAVIIGSGSASFEMLRYLSERLPAMITPRWVDSRIQPIAVRDVLRYLVGAADVPADVSRGFDIGGSDVLTYRDMMLRYAAVAQPAQAPDRQGAGAHHAPVEPLGRRHHPRAERDRPPARREPGARGDLQGARHRAARARPAGGSARLRALGRAWPCSGCASTTSRPRGRRRTRRTPPATRCPPTPTGPAARCTSTTARAGSTPRRRRCGRSSRASAASTAGTRGRWAGGRAASWTG